MFLTNTLNLLIVDDDDVDRMAVRRALQKTDLRINLTEVWDCETTIHTLEQQSFDCVLLDYLLPDGNALSLIRTLRGRGHTLPVVVMTGQGDEEIAVDVMKAGASDYLSKSKILPPRLAQVIQGAIRLYEAELQVKQANQKLRETNERLRIKTQQLEQQQQQIHLQNLQLIEASQLKSQFLATMSHEIRTPMNAIMGFAQILLQETKGPLTQAQRKMMQRVFDNSHNLLHLLNKLLDFSKLESGRTDLVPTLTHLPKLVLATTEELRSLSDQKHLQLTTHINLKNRKIYTDADRLRQILVNLISNAIKFTDFGSVEVHVSELEGDKVAIAIQDTGIGIAEHDRDHIFEAFCQADQSITRQHAGVGLGLAITQSLVQMMQGEIRVESRLGEGATFCVILPRHLDLPEIDDPSPPVIVAHS